MKYITLKEAIKDENYIDFISQYGSVVIHSTEYKIKYLPKYKDKKKLLRLLDIAEKLIDEDEEKK